MKKFQLKTKAEDLPKDLQFQLAFLAFCFIASRVSLIFLALALLGMFLWMSKLTIFIVGLQVAFCVMTYWALRTLKKHLVRRVSEMEQE